MAKDIHVPARIVGGKIPVKASLGQTVIVTEGPETYTGPTTVIPSESEQTLQTADKLLTNNVTVNPIPSEYVDAKADYDNALSAFGVQSDLADGITALTDYSNEITGEVDETLSDAVRSLADGYDDGSLVASLLDGSFDGEYENNKPINGIRYQYRFANLVGLRKIKLPNLTGATGAYCFSGCSNLIEAVLPNVQTLTQYTFNTCGKLSHVDVRNVERIEGFSFRSTGEIDKIVFLKPLTITGQTGISAEEMYMCQIPESIVNGAFNYRVIQNLYVPWAEGEIETPWLTSSFRNVHYNTVFDSDGNIIS